MIDLIITIALLGLALGYFLIFMKSEEKREKGSAAQDEGFIELCKDTQNFVNAFTTTNIAEFNVSARDAENQRELRKEQARRVWLCCSGDEAARTSTLDLVGKALEKLAKNKKADDYVDFDVRTATNKVKFFALLSELAKIDDVKPYTELSCNTHEDTDADEVWWMQDGPMPSDVFDRYAIKFIESLSESESTDAFEETPKKDERFEVTQQAEDTVYMEYDGGEGSEDILSFEARKDRNRNKKKLRKKSPFAKFLFAVGHEYGPVTDKMLDGAYRAYCSHLNDNDKMDILTMMVYAYQFGLGIAEPLIFDKGIIEEIQLGVSGASSESFSFSEEAETEERIPRQYDSIYVSIHGKDIPLRCISMESYAELERVCRNLLRGTNVGEITESDPFKFGQTRDGRRETVIRPPQAESWCSFSRKFDAVQITTLDELYKWQDDHKTLVDFLRLILSAEGKIIVTGPFRAGKTTLLRALIDALDPSFSVRALEYECYELGLNEYMPHRNAKSVSANGDISQGETVRMLMKKLSANVIVVGELSNDMIIFLYSQLCRDTKMSMATGHENTTKDLIESLAEGISAYGGKNELYAERAAVNLVNFNIHLERNSDGIPYIQYIDEVVPTESDNDTDYKNMSLNEVLGSINETLKRKHCYKVFRLMQYDEKTKKYQQLNEISLNRDYHIYQDV